MDRYTHHPDPKEHQETRELVKSAFSLAQSLGIKRLVVQANEISDIRLVETLRKDERIIWGARELQGHPQAARSIHNPDFLETLRELAAMAISTVTDATAVVISASSGTVSVYDGGDTVLDLERAHPGA